MIIYPNLLLSCRPNHLHELIHALFIPLYPNASPLFHEGIATYYGGSSQKNYKEQFELLKKYLQENPNTDLADFNSYNELINDQTNPFYTVGALLIEQALKTGGAEKALELFQYSSTDEAFENVFNVTSSEIHQYIKNLILSK